MTVIEIEIVDNPREPRERQMVAMSKGGMTAGKIAAKLGITRNVVAGILYRARKAGRIEYKLPKGKIRTGRRGSQRAKPAAIPDAPVFDLPGVALKWGSVIPEVSPCVSEQSKPSYGTRPGATDGATKPRAMAPGDATEHVHSNAKHVHSNAKTFAFIPPSKPVKPVTLKPAASASSYGPVSDVLNPPEDPPGKIHILNAHHGHCRNVVGYDSNHLAFFCSSPVVPGRSWCEHHMSINTVWRRA